MTLKLGIVGHGFVGKAVEKGFSENVEAFIVDPRIGTEVADLESFNPDVVFMCVPTPMNSDGSIDSSILSLCLTELSNLTIKPVVVIKSTVIPVVLEEVGKLYPKLVYNPEFLREKHAAEDFLNPDMLILGGSRADVDFVEKVYVDHTKCKPAPVFKSDIASASLVKYTINSFLATKVLFFNQLKDVFDASGTGIDWANFVEMVSTDKRIGTSHMQVPGHDGKPGFGGACFTKDCAAFLHYAKSIGHPLSVLQEAVDRNIEIRKGYDLDDREKEQNVSYVSKN